MATRGPVFTLAPLLTMLILVSTAMLFGQPAIADVEIEYDEKFNFSWLRRFAWTEGTPSEDPLLQKRIEAAIQRELIPRGIRKDAEDPDFLIAIHFEGDAVVVDMVDLQTGEIFWKAMGTGAVPKKEAKLERKINKAAANMFKNFPPIKKKK